MPRINHRALDLVADVSAQQVGLITSAQLAEIGFSESGIAYRSRQGGPWRRVLPGIYLVTPGVMDEEQRCLAARLYVRDPCLITGGTVLRDHGVRAAADVMPGEVLVLVPHHRRRASTHFVRVQRTRHWPELDPDSAAFAPLARAAIDACRTLGRRSEVRAILAELVRDGHASVDELWDEYSVAQRRRTALVRETLLDLRAGPVSVAELELHQLWADSPLPEALWNADLYRPNGEFLARPDVYLPEHGVVVEVDSREHHWSVDDWDRTMRRHAKLSALGLVALHVSPRRVRDDWDGLVRDVLAAIEAQVGRALPPLRVEPREP